MEIPLNLQLPCKSVKLHIPELVDSAFVFDSSKTRKDPISPISDEKLAVFSSQANVYHGKSLSISWRLSGEDKIIELSPLELDANRLPGQGVCLRVLLPCAALKNCVTISDVNREFTLDFISVTGYICTFTVPQSWLLQQSSVTPQSHTHDLKTPQIDKTITEQLSKRVVISQPYNIGSIRPIIMKSAGPHLLLILLADGEFLKLERPAPLKPFTHTPLHDPYRNSGSGMLAKLFNFSSDKVPGYPSLSLDSVISAELINTRHVVTYSVDNALRLWCLQSNMCIQKIPSRENACLRIRPTSYICVKESKVAVIYENEVSLFRLNDSGVAGEDAKLEEVFNKRTLIPQEQRHWFVVGLFLLDASDDILVAFKLNTAAKFYLVRDGNWYYAGGYDHSNMLEITTSSSIDTIKQRILKVPNIILDIALRKIAKSADVPSNTAISLDTISSLLESTTDADIHTQWLRFDTICRDLEAKGIDLLNVAPAMSTTNSMFFWLVRASGLSLLSFKTSSSSDDKQSISGNNEALEMSRKLVGDVPLHTTEKLANVLLKSDLITTRISNACSILRPYLDQTILNEIGRSGNNSAGQAIKLYIDTFGIASTAFTNAASELTPKTQSANETKLSEFGQDAINTLIFEYSAQQSEKFTMLCALSVIALVEGWSVSGDADYSELLKLGICNLRRFMFITQLGPSNLYLNVDSVNLEEFGIALAQQVLSKTNELSLLSRLLPHTTTKAQLDRFNLAADQLEVSSEVLLLTSFAALTAGQESNGVAIAQKISLSRPWIAEFGERPATQASWFYHVAKYAGSVNAKDAASWLIKYGESISSERDNKEILEYLFELSLESKDIPAAYTAFTRMFRNVVDRDDIIAQYAVKLINVAADISAEEASSLMVKYPFSGFTYIIDKVLAANMVFGTVPAYKLRYAFNTQRENYVGAAQAIYDHIKSESSIDAVHRAELYSYCLSSLSLVDPPSRWLYVDSECKTFDEISQEFQNLQSLMSMDS